MTEAVNITTLVEWLPFYVNGTLLPHDRAQIDAALVKSSWLREELRASQGLYALVQEKGEALITHAGIMRAGAPNARLKKLLEQIVSNSSQPAASCVLTELRPETSPGFWQRLTLPKWQGVVMASLIAVIAMQAIWIRVPQAQTVQKEYTTLAGPENKIPLLANDHLILRITSGTPWGQVTRLLEDEELRITDGPEDDVITVTFLPNREANDVAIIITRLQKNPMIAFVGKAQ